MLIRGYGSLGRPVPVTNQIGLHLGLGALTHHAGGAGTLEISVANQVGMCSLDAAGVDPGLGIVGYGNAGEHGGSNGTCELLS